MNVEDKQTKPQFPESYCSPLCFLETRHSISNSRTEKRGPIYCQIMGKGFQQHRAASASKDHNQHRGGMCLVLSINQRGSCMSPDRISVLWMAIYVFLNI
jgi:hypothetical protein